MKYHDVELSIDSDDLHDAMLRWQQAGLAGDSATEQSLVVLRDFLREQCGLGDMLELSLHWLQAVYVAKRKLGHFKDGGYTHRSSRGDGIGPQPSLFSP